MATFPTLCERKEKLKGSKHSGIPFSQGKIKISGNRKMLFDDNAID